jgi:osmotically-inducible protein OsmY
MVELQHDALAELKWDPIVRDLVVHVDVDDCVVTLSGSVSSEAERRAAEDAAWRVGGVKAVINHLEVFLPKPDLLSDEELAHIATLCLQSAALLPAEGLSVAAKGGWVTLSGQVPWQYQRAEAEHVVSRLRGVAGVINLIVIAPYEQPADISRKIEDALRRCASLDAQWITVESYKGQVVLRGSVRSRPERAQAEAIAWCAPGVAEVINHLAILS